ncbi:hypothetical protein PaMx35_ORFb2 [Pseudomonas phage PaMx35]|nr:hypothetical protein PaMx35_ORFb2 [Pseudomonas phage PaMx35]
MKDKNWYEIGFFHGVEIKESKKRLLDCYYVAKNLDKNSRADYMKGIKDGKK